MGSDAKAPPAALPTTAIHQRAADAPVASLSPTDATRFMFSGVPGQPEFFHNTGGRGDSAPLHRHAWATFELVLEGTVRFVIDGEAIIAGAGDFVYTPPNAPHTYVVESERAIMVGVNHPAPRFAELQMRAMPLFQDPAGPDMQKIVELAREHGVEVLGPPLQAS